HPVGHAPAGGVLPCRPRLAETFPESALPRGGRGTQESRPDRRATREVAGLSPPQRSLRPYAARGTGKAARGGMAVDPRRRRTGADRSIGVRRGGMMAITDDRLTPESLERYFRAGVPTQHILCEEPDIRLRIEPGGERLVLRTPHDGTSPTVKGLRHVEIDVVDHEDGTWSLVRIHARDMHYEAYGLAVAVAEAMRGGASFAAATNAAMTNLRSLLASRARLSESQQLGLVGELLVLDVLLTDAGTGALDWWLGHAAEQHDFAFPDFDVEVKTTVSERRRHMISGVDQLRPNPGRPLWLVSIQVTRAGGAEGFSLASLVGELRSRV